MRYTLKQLQYFVAAAETGSVKQASKAIPISQPSVSAAISQLEREFDVQLFLRHHARGLSLTAAGRRMLRESRNLLAQANNLYSVAREISDEVHGAMSVGCFVTLAPMIMPELLHTFSKEHSNSQLSLVEGDHESILSGLRRAEIDIAICYDLQLPEDIVFEPLVSLKPQVLVAANHALSSADLLSIRQLADESMILLDLPYSREYFLSLFYQAGVTPKIHSRSANQEVVRTMVANGYGFTLANVRPKSRLALDGKELVSIPLKGRHRPMVIGLVSMLQERKSRLLETFEKHCHKHINRQHIPGMEAARS
ncbi:MAG: DNA-binding transcriptional LysR family regulator [Gammaproteobacteria bacterium]|jgi:DNA-binding transcriptional LysR family regulator